MTLMTVLFTVFALIVFGFQIGLGLGAPWGSLAMGGIHPGKFPKKLRIAALVQGVIILLFNAVVLSRAEVMLDQFYSLSRILIWFVVGFFVLGTIMNLMTKSKWERRVWAPINVVLLIIAIVIALS